MKIFCKYFLTLICLYAYVGTTLAHDFYQNNMLSPQVSNTFRYGDINTSLYTGRLRVSIPIYSLSDPDFKFNISLGYSSDGFQPCKSSGYVGQDWFLQAGGCITREVRNYPDEMYRELTEIGKLAEGMYIFTSHTNFDKEDIFAQNTNAVRDCSSFSYNVGNDCNVDVDCLPDIFHFNFWNYQGSFMINNSGKIAILEGDYIEVNLSKTEDRRPNLAAVEFPIPIDSSQITIKTKDGYTFVFGGDLSSVEFTYALKNGQQALKQSPPFITTWFLSKVVAPNGRVIKYYYKGKHFNAQSDQHLMVFNVYNDLFARSVVPNSVDHHVKYNYTKECILDSISISGSSPLHIHFYNSLSEKKYNHPIYSLCKENYQLDSISVSSQGRVLKRARLQYEYRMSHLSNNNTYCFRWRFLTNVALSGQGEYRLSYNHITQYPNLYITTNDDFNNLIDSYGYWKESSLQGMLKDIYFPTGGHQCLSYENHTYGSERRLRMLNSGRDMEQYTYHVGGIKGGARIWQVETFDGDELVEKRRYAYTEDNSEVSSGVYFNKLLFYPANGGIPTVITAPTNYSLLDTHIGYSDVKEYIYDNTGTEYIRNVYKFDTGLESFSSLGNSSINSPAVNVSSDIYYALSGMLAYNENLYPKGKLLLHKQYNGSTLIRSKQYRYNGIPISSSELIPATNLSLGCIDTIVVFSHYADAPISRKLYVYPDVLIQEVDNEYDAQGLPLIYNHTYLHDRKLRVSRKTLTDSKGRIHFTQYKYPDDVECRNNWTGPNRAIPALYILTKSHRIDMPIEEVSGYIDNGTEFITSGTINLYKTGFFSNAAHHLPPMSNFWPDSMTIISHDSLIQMEELQFYSYPYLYRTMTLALNCPITNYQPLHMIGDSLIFDPAYRVTCEYKFNKANRPLFVHSWGGAPITYTWNNEDDIYPASKTEEGQTTNYTYIPYVGVQSATDARGNTIYYSYDYAGRLVEVYRIVNGVKQIMSAYQYHYKTE